MLPKYPLEPKAAHVSFEKYLVTTACKRESQGDVAEQDVSRLGAFACGDVLRLEVTMPRVLGVTAIADTLPEAIDEAYKKLEKVHFDNKYFRHDIGQRALKAL